MFLSDGSTSLCTSTCVKAVAQCHSKVGLLEGLYSSIIRMNAGLLMNCHLEAFGIVVWGRATYDSKSGKG